MLRRHIARSFEVLYNSWLGLKDILRCAGLLWGRYWNSACHKRHGIACVSTPWNYWMHKEQNSDVKKGLFPCSPLWWKRSRKVVGKVKADSHKACRSHAPPMPFPLPCRAAEGLECVFPITQCGRVWFTLAMPCPYHAPTMPFFSSPRHSMAAEGRLVGCQRSASSSGYHSEFHKVVIRCIPDSDAGGQFETKHRLSWMRKRVVAAHYKKDSLLHCGLAVWIFLATMRTFTKDAALSEQGMGAAWQGNGMARHGNSMLCVNRPLLYAHPGKVTLKMYTNLQENLITGMWVTLWQIFVLHNRCLACWPIAKLV